MNEVELVPLLQDVQILRIQIPQIRNKIHPDKFWDESVETKIKL